MKEESHIYSISRGYGDHGKLPFEGTKYGETLYGGGRNDHKHNQTCSKNRKKRKKRK